MKFIGTLLLGFIIGWFAHLLLQKNTHNTLTQEETSNIEQILLNTTQTSVVKTYVNTTSQTIQIDKYAPQLLMNKVHNSIKNNNYQQALTHLTDIILQTQYIYSEQELHNIFLTLAKKVLQQYPKPLTQIELLQDFINTLPNNLELRFLLATQLVKIKNYEEAKYQLSFLKYNQDWLTQFESLTKKIHYAKIFTNKEINIPLIKKHNAWHIKVVINNQNAVLILDTGAMMTTISQKFLNIATDENIIMSTANGKTNATIYANNTLQIGEITEQNVKIVGLPKSKLPENIDGLLGMDWLGKFHFIIDAKNNTLQLTQK